MREAKTGHIMITKQKKVREDPIILVPGAEEEVYDLSWMIQDDQLLEKSVKKAPKKKKK